MPIEFRRTAILLTAALALAACSNAEDEDLAAAGGAGGQGGFDQQGLGGQFPPGSVGYFTNVVGDRVFFETDSSTLTPAGRATLDAQAQWFVANPSATAVIEGHADERGTREYNLALGARRANSVYNYLISAGVDAGRLRTVTFGKERPEAVCSDESCWSQNRRSVSVVANAPVS
ncbi:MAG: peptidoglycan-associated lipoprotein Pal [Pseudomonadota bacterium]